jgi:hypothetical protein
MLKDTIRKYTRRSQQFPIIYIKIVNNMKRKEGRRGERRVEGE